MSEKTKITRKELQSFNELIEREKELLNKILESHEDIYKVFYNESLIVIQFKCGKSVGSDYLDNLSDLVDYKSYSIGIVTITEEFMKLKYKEQVLQLNIIL